MTHYNKGANAERELLLMLFKQGFAVARVAGSGMSDIPSPDIIALKNGKGFCIEAKAWKGNYLNIEVSKFDELSAWSMVSGMDFIIAWKVPRKGWFFLKEDQLRSTEKFYTIKLSDALKQGMDFTVLTGNQTKK